ncbi:MAG: DUF4491 family protein [Treponema sp.]|nr:DUF4491 family protein [Treponema sp.]
MSAQWTGLVAAAATFAGVWAGHVGVRRIEFRAARLWPPAVLLAAGGLGLLALAATSGSGPGAAAWGILGMTLVFDALELFRQFRRVREGRAPANPGNPRHAPYLAARTFAPKSSTVKGGAAKGSAAPETGAAAADPPASARSAKGGSE